MNSLHKRLAVSLIAALCLYALELYTRTGLHGWLGWSPREWLYSAAALLVYWLLFAAASTVLEALPLPSLLRGEPSGCRPLLLSVWLWLLIVFIAMPESRMATVGAAVAVWLLLMLAGALHRVRNIPYASLPLILGAAVFASFIGLDAWVTRVLVIEFPSTAIRATAALAGLGLATAGWLVCGFMSPFRRSPWRFAGA
jgi:hypothetical protein